MEAGPQIIYYTLHGGPWIRQSWVYLDSMDDGFSMSGS
jgi:hypothetical protein